MSARLGSVVSVNVSATTGVRKAPVGCAQLVAGSGVAGDAHAGPGIRQVSLLAVESFERMPSGGTTLHPGDFAENLTTRGVDLLALPVGTRLRVGASAVIEISQHGKRCHSGCAIAREVGACVMPREGVFAIVAAGGFVSAGDAIALEAQPAAAAAVAPAPACHAPAAGSVVA